MNAIRINNPQSIDKVAIAADLATGSEVIIQFMHLPNHALLPELNALCQHHNNQLTIRFYSNDFDCAVLNLLPQVKSLAVDCVMRVQNTDAIKKLNHLRRLDFGVYEFKEVDFLDTDNFNHLTQLSLGANKSKNLNLAHLQKMTQLNKLFVDGHTKNIEAIGTLKHLNHCRLHGITKTKLDFINAIQQLKTLELTLGSRENIDEIAENTIENLVIGRVRGFSQLNHLSHFKALKYLNISEQIQLEKLAFTDDFSPLTALTLHECKTLNTLTGLMHLRALRYLRIWRTNIELARLLAQQLPSTLNYFSFTELKNKNNSLIKDKLAEMGYEEATWDNLPQNIHTTL